MNRLGALKLKGKALRLMLRSPWLILISTNTKPYTNRKDSIDRPLHPSLDEAELKCQLNTVGLLYL